MSSAKKEHEYDVVALQTVAVMSSLGVKLTQSQIDAMNPARRFDPIKPELAEEKRNNDTRMGMDLIGKVLKEMPVLRKR